MITIYANYEGDPSDLLGTAPVYDLAPGAEQTALFAFIVPTLNIPITIPVAVRTGSDYGLRFTVTDITQITPLARRGSHALGISRRISSHSAAFPKGSPGVPAGCPGLADTSCIASGVKSSFPGGSSHRQPDYLQRWFVGDNAGSRRPTRIPSTYRTPNRATRR